ncbi:hypothetical protein L873DRAFT_1811099 [Choiromyces venosus 120613-1]|uniref:Uncharacterized protein n=1 Tax=Choiromyces venosus 120613-1 TaxID=1336337 RepID=A0A3N4JEP7_9PEZI|nr:hypothetical protein L873DRAFT_1811099 [Choiromyces venosus 120613-1]
MRPLTPCPLGNLGSGAGGRGAAAPSGLLTACLPFAVRFEIGILLCSTVLVPVPGYDRSVGLSWILVGFFFVFVGRMEGG